MKKIFFFVFILFSTIYFAGCQNNQLGEKAPYGDNYDTLEGVTIRTAAQSYPVGTTSIEIFIENESSEEVTYGAPFTIETFHEDAWYQVEPTQELSFIMIAYILKPDEDATEEISLEFYEAFEPGRYRIVKEINNAAVTAEFEIVE